MKMVEPLTTEQLTQLQMLVEQWQSGHVFRPPDVTEAVELICKIVGGLSAPDQAPQLHELADRIHTSLRSRTPREAGAVLGSLLVMYAHDTQCTPDSVLISLAYIIREAQKPETT